MDAMERHSKSARRKGLHIMLALFLQACQRGRRWYEPLALRFCILKMAHTSRDDFGVAFYSDNDKKSVINDSNSGRTIAILYRYKD